MRREAETPINQGNQNQEGPSEQNRPKFSGAITIQGRPIGPNPLDQETVNMHLEKTRKHLS